MNSARFFAGCVGLALALAAIPASADDNTDCTGVSASGESRLVACTRLIERGTLMGLDLAAAYFYRGNAFYALGEHDKAITDYTTAIEIMPGIAVFYYGRGNSWLEKKVLQRAISDYTAALRLNPSYVPALNNRALAYFRAGEAEKALPDADRAVALAPREFIPLETRAHILKALGRKDEAIRDLRAALALNPPENMKNKIVGALNELGVEA